jgi:SAM-dependent methyltransferase
LRTRYPGVDWHCGEISAFLRERPNRFDIISMFHVLEHIPKPKLTVDLVDRSLRKDGLIVIEVPDARGGVARLTGSRWDYYLEHHVNYFDVRSLKRLFGQFGYRMIFLEKTFHFSFPQGNVVKDFVKRKLAEIGLNSIIRTAWKK